MSHRNATTLTGYIVAAIVMIPFFWLTLGDAYGRFMVAFDPNASMFSYYIEPYTGHVTGLVCLAAPMILAYFLKSVMANWIDSTWEMAAQIINWTIPHGRKLLASCWQKGQQALRELKAFRAGKPDDPS